MKGFFLLTSRRKASRQHSKSRLLVLLKKILYYISWYQSNICSFLLGLWSRKWWRESFGNEMCAVGGFGWCLVWLSLQWNRVVMGTEKWPIYYKALRVVSIWTLSSVDIIHWFVLYEGVYGIMHIHACRKKLEPRFGPSSPHKLHLNKTPCVVILPSAK